MTHFLKKLFIPHKHNHFRPHILRRRTVIFFAAFIFILEAVFLAAFFLVIPETSLLSDILPLALVTFTNENRQQNNLSALATNALLEKAAQAKADDMAQKGYFSHTTPDGKNPWYWLDQAGYKYSFAGENLAVNFFDSKDVVNAWMASPTHKANILAGYYTEIGIASQKGLYQGREAIFVVQFFGKPVASRDLAAAAVSPDKPTEQTAQPVAQQPKIPADNAKKPAANKQPPAPKKETQDKKSVEKKEQVATSSSAATDIAGESSTIRQADALATSESVSLSHQIDFGPAGADLSFLEKISSMPRSLLNAIYMILAGVVLVSLLLKIFIKIRIQHPPLIFNGAVLLFILISVIYINNLLAQYGLV